MFALVDCNNFFASCEAVFKPHLWGQPVVILSNNDGCVIARSKKAKELGIPMGAPAFEHRETFNRYGFYIFSSNFTLYGDMSRRVFETLKTFEYPLEIYSIDETFIKLPPNQDFSSLGDQVCERVTQWTGIPVSAGIAPTKTLAKLANRLAKKQHIKTFCITENDYDILKKVPLEDLWGVGKRHLIKLRSAGLQNAYDLTQASDTWVKKYFTIEGLKLKMELCGIPCLDLRDQISPKKSITSSRSFSGTFYDYTSIENALCYHAGNAARKLRKTNQEAHYLHVFLKTKNGYSSEIQTIPSPTSHTPTFAKQAIIALKRIFQEGVGYKKIGVTLGGLTSKQASQIDIFTLPTTPKQDQLMKTVDEINTRYERNTLFFGSEGMKQPWQGKRDKLSPKYTTKWEDLPVVYCLRKASGRDS